MADSKFQSQGDIGHSVNSTDVLIIGAGISGLTVAIDMIRQGNGRKFVIVEKSIQVGGTWNDNVYPGCCCDVWSHLYSLSFSPNPDWTRQYPGQAEIHKYLIHVAQKYGLYQHIRFSTSVASCRFDKSTNSWISTVNCDSGKGAEFSPTYNITSRFLVSAVGQLNLPKYPQIKGLDSFKGKLMHSARWDSSYDIRGKKIGVIGNGATGIQIIPEVAKVAANVTVFHRSPHWMVPRDDGEISTVKQTLYRYLPMARKIHRAGLMDVRESFYNAIWDTEGEMHKMTKALFQEALNGQLPGPENTKLREVLTPSYPLGCKRILISDDYFPALARENVELEAGEIKKVTEAGVHVGPGFNSRRPESTERFHELDVLVCATGFKATQFLWPIDIRTGDNIRLEDIWNEGAEAYLGMTVPELPNFAMVFGPNTNLGHNSIILMIEAQSRYINALISKVVSPIHQDPVSGKSLRLQPRKEVSQAYNDRMQEKLKASAFASPQCNSWYKSANGRITTNWSGTVVDYQKLTSSVNWEDFIIEGPGSEDIYKTKITSWPRVVEESQKYFISLGAAACGAALLSGVLVARRFIR